MQLPPQTQRPRMASAGYGNRDLHVRKVLTAKESEWTKTEPLRVFCGTWNVNDQKIDVDVFPWLASCAEDLPDIVALGFQELDLSKEAFIFTDSNREKDCVLACEHALWQLKPKVTYKQLKLVRLVGIMLIVYVKEELAKHLHDVAVGSVPTGIMGMLGNKGGVAVRFTMHLTTFCIVNSHLAAHPEELERRNQDYKDISQRMVFMVGSDNLETTLSEHDVVLWMGDLNYRLHQVDIPTVKELISKREYAKLGESDQLKQEMAAKRVFVDYKEQLPTFQPTYKFDVGTDVYDTSDKSRCPAWTDRILYRNAGVAVRGDHADKNGVRPLWYRSHMGLQLSDHKPVSAQFDIDVKVKDEFKYRKVLEDVMKEMDKLENEHLPMVKVDCLELNFGDVRFLESLVKEIHLLNIGQVMAEFTFATKPNESTYCREWLKVSPHTACLMPGETLQIRFEVYVDAQTAAGMNAGDDSLNDILVLHLEGGKDFFITVIGNYLPSSFGMSLLTLVTLADPVRSVSIAELQKKERAASAAGAQTMTPVTGFEVVDLRETGTAIINSVTSAQSGGFAAADDSRVMPIPKELYYLCNCIQRDGDKAEDLYQQRGLHNEVIAIRESLDTCLTADLPGSVHSVSEALLNFLEALPEPVVPRCLHSFALASVASGSHHEVFARLPQVHRNVFEYIIALMQYLLKYSATNNLDVDKLTELFGAVMLRPSSPSITPGTAARLPQPKGKADVRLQNERSRLAAAFLKAFVIEKVLKKDS